MVGASLCVAGRAMGNLFASDKKAPSAASFDFGVRNPMGAGGGAGGDGGDGGGDRGGGAGGDRGGDRGGGGSRRGGNGGGSSGQKHPSSDAGAAAAGETRAFLAEGARVLAALDGFVSTKEQQQKAMRSTKDEAAQIAAFEAVVPNATLLEGFFQYGQQMEATAAEAVATCVKLCGAAGASAKDQQAWLQANPNLASCVCDMLHFALKFDLAKQMKPDIMNEFAYYRRNIGKFPNLATVSETKTNEIAMWFASANPMLTHIQTALSGVFTANRKGLSQFLAHVANICCSMLMRGDCTSNEETIYCMHVATAAIVSFDHVHPVGVFKKSSGFAMKKFVLQLKSDDHAALDTRGFLNSIRFSTKHYRSSDTPVSLKRLIED